MITEALTKVVDGQNLDQIAATKLMDSILEEKITPLLNKRIKQL